VALLRIHEAGRIRLAAAKAMEVAMARFIRDGIDRYWVVR
jgi:hypothetical protein